MDSDIDTRLHDRVALAEIELYAEVLIAVATADRRLTIAELDAVLGVLPRRSRRDPRPPHPRRHRRTPSPHFPG
ncbi:hypothetical protein ACFOVU_20605 [Nocardiopsis sediminis]|uniref:TerB family tellurite resistance protein n=1 Tax=Nocardiopsis sediminis TaxID=1778267 RepID=A0ABV8FSH0_9ACTN